MIIQRTWKSMSEGSSGSISSTDTNFISSLGSSLDDYNSNLTSSSIISSNSNSPPMLNLESTPMSLPTDTTKYITTPTIAETMLQRLKQRLGGSGSNAMSHENAMRSLELLRISVQKAFNNEIDSVIKRFMEKYFKPAFNNINTNLDMHFTTQDTFKKMSCALLENSKAQYNINRPTLQPLVIEQALTKPVYRTRSTNKRVEINATPIITQPLKKLSTIRQTPTIIAPPQDESLTTQSIQMKQLTVAQIPTRRQIFWNTAQISTTTKFVLDVKANQAFGFAEGKERLASKHPELIRYLPDNDDREWLIAHDIISTSNRNARFLFLIFDEICKLRQMHEVYRVNTEINLSAMHVFNVPEFMIHKMKLFFVDLNIKSRGLITNSFSMNTFGNNSNVKTVNRQNNQTTALSTRCVPSSEAPITSTLVNISSPTDSTSAKLSQHNKLSTLSSSHATLTALLNNSLTVSYKSGKSTATVINKQRK